tara:strand:+ start:262 stop:1020 length:759 start_codon:yes stop_codon:yes gene_type:complete
MPNKIPASSGGGGGGGVSLDSVSFDSVVDLTDGSWTLVDPNSLVQSVAFSGGFNTITMNALGSGGSEFRWSSSAGSNNAPRWYRAWNYTGTTTRATSTDLSNYTNLLAIDRTVNDFHFEVIGGVATDPTSTTRNNIDGMGAGASNNTGESNARYGHWRNTSMPVSSVSTAIVKTLQTGQYGAKHMGTSVFMLLNASNEHVQRGATSGANTLSAGVDLFQIVGVGTRTNGTTIGAGNQVKFSLHQGSLKWSLP